jgi:hypothetical protein
MELRGGSRRRGQKRTAQARAREEKSPPRHPRWQPLLHRAPPCPRAANRVPLTDFELGFAIGTKVVAEHHLTR